MNPAGLSAASALTASLFGDAASSLGGEGEGMDGTGFAEALMATLGAQIAPMVQQPQAQTPAAETGPQEEGLRNGAQASAPTTQTVNTLVAMQDQSAAQEPDAGASDPSSRVANANENNAVGSLDNEPQPALTPPVIPANDADIAAVTTPAPPVVAGTADAPAPAPADAVVAITAKVVETTAPLTEGAGPHTPAEQKAGATTKSHGHEARRADGLRSVHSGPTLEIDAANDEFAATDLGSVSGGDAQDPIDAPAPEAADLSHSEALTRNEIGATADLQAKAPAAIATKAGPETVPALAGQLVEKLAAKATRFEIQLDPHGLGKVDVKVEINHRGELSAALHFENPAAAQELRARASDLQSALQQAGFDLTKTQLHFSGGGDFGQGLWNQQNQQSDRQSFAADRRVFVDLSDASDIPATPSRSARAGGVDLTV